MAIKTKVLEELWQSLLVNQEYKDNMIANLKSINKFIYSTTNDAAF